MRNARELLPTIERTSEEVRDLASDVRKNIPHLGIGDGTVIENAIVDKDCRVGANVQIVNRNKIQEGEGPNFVIREGVVVIPKAKVLADGTVIESLHELAAARGPLGSSQARFPLPADANGRSSDPCATFRSSRHRFFIAVHPL